MSYTSEPSPARPAYNIESFPGGVICTDGIPSRRQADWPERAAERGKAAPGFGSWWTYYSVNCATWPARDRDRHAGDFDGRTAGPALIVHARFDPNTHYGNAVSLAKTMPGAKLVTIDGYGHNTVGTSTCRDAAVSRYLLTGKVAGLPSTCAQDVKPFAPRG